MKTEMNSTYAIDTNILIYAFDATDQRKKDIAEEILTNTFIGEISLIITNQVLAEFASVVTKKLRFDNEELEQILTSIEKNPNWTIINYSVENIITASKSDHFWDSLIAATIQKKNIPLLTENTKHFTHTSLKTINPFEKKFSAKV